jgi:hypothetical protein
VFRGALDASYKNDGIDVYWLYDDAGSARWVKDVSLVDKVIELDTEWRSTRGGLDNAKKVLNQVQKKIGEFMKKKESPPPELMKEKQDADAEITKLEAKEKELIEARDNTRVGNLVHEDAPLVAAPPAQRGLPADTLRRCLMASGLAEPVASGTVPSRSWRAVGDGLLLQQQWLKRKLQQTKLKLNLLRA